MLHHVVLEECASFIFQGQNIDLIFVQPEDHSLIIFIFYAVLEH